MPDFVAVCLSLTFLAVVGLLIWQNHQSQQRLEKLSQPSEWLLEVLRQNQLERRDLLNRLTAADLPAYSAMTHLPSSVNPLPSSEYIGTSDEAEAARIAQYLGQQGIGEQYYVDNDLRDTLGELGVDFAIGDVAGRLPE